MTHQNYISLSNRDEVRNTRNHIFEITLQTASPKSQIAASHVELTQTPISALEYRREQWNIWCRHISLRIVRMTQLRTEKVTSVNPPMKSTHDEDRQSPLSNAVRA